MTRTLLLATTLALGFAGAAIAGMPVQQPSKSDSLMTRIAEGCGRDEWRDEHGRCHPMFNGKACPRGYHLGPERKRCLPDI
jgi:hypothetical protein